MIVSAIAPRSRPRCSQAVDVGERRAFDPFGGEHLARGARPFDLAARGNPDRPRHWRAISAIAAASMRRSISSLTDCASVATASTGRNRRAGSCQRSTRRAAKKKAFEIARELLLDAGPQDLHRHVAALARAWRDAPGRSRPRPPAGRIRRTSSRPSRAEIGANSARASSMRKWRQPVLQLRAILAPAAAPTRSGRVARNCPSLM